MRLNPGEAARVRPVDVRNKFNLEIGDLILFLEEDGKLVLRKG